MEILVINGSPKGKNSVTLQTVLYLQKRYPNHTFQIFHAGTRVRSLEKDFSPAAQMLEKAQILLFSYPVYTFLAPSQLHRFLELMQESKIDLRGKFATQITTSKHFYDMTAHIFLQENLQDMGMKVVKGLSADMDDLLTEKGRTQAEEFLKYFLWCVHHNHYEKLPVPRLPFTPAPTDIPASVPKKPGNVVVLTDLGEQDISLKRMLCRFKAVFPYEILVLNLGKFPFRGGCLGCFRCAVSGKCVYKDGFESFLRQYVHKAQAIVYAFSVSHHSMGYHFKLFDDRQFCEGHRTAISGKPIGYLVSGPYSQEQNLQTVVEGRAQVENNFLAGIATDEQSPNEDIDRMAQALVYGLEHPYVPPQNFYGIGGMKIFRDLVWQMQGLMQADHKFYKAHGYYDFPQKQLLRMLAMYPVGMMMKSPDMMKKMGSHMHDGILMPYKKVLEHTKP